MKLHQLPKTTTKTKKRPGRGYGSGTGGHTSTRGTKGQKARSKVATWFEGGQLPLSKRLPFLRGKDRFKVINNAPVTVNVYQLQGFEKNTLIDQQSLVASGLITAKEAVERPIKILGMGELSVALKISNRILTSASALEKIKKAGGSIEEETKQDK